MNFKSGLFTSVLLLAALSTLAHLAPLDSAAEKIGAIGAAVVVFTFLYFWLEPAGGGDIAHPFISGGLTGSVLCVVIELAAVHPLLNHFGGPDRNVPEVSYLEDSVVVRSCQIEEGLGPSNLHFRFVNVIRLEWKRPGKYTIEFPDYPTLNFTHEKTSDSTTEETMVKVPYNLPITVSIKNTYAGEAHILDKFPLVKRPGAEEIGNGFP
jgi:hypothetical protein